MKEEKKSKLTQYRANYASLVTALFCLYNVYTSWGDNWLFVVLFCAGVLICGTFAYYDLIRVLRQRRSKLSN